MLLITGQSWLHCPGPTVGPWEILGPLHALNRLQRDQASSSESCSHCGSHLHTITPGPQRAPEPEAGPPGTGRLPCTLPWDGIHLLCVLTLPSHFLDVSKSPLPRVLRPYQGLFQLFLLFPPSSQCGMNRCVARLGMTKLRDLQWYFSTFLLW